MKEGIPHVQPPTELLAQMLTIRLHLDDADAMNGALRVVPGGHRLGRLAPDQLEATRANLGETTCVVPAGGAMLMRPLLPHASGRSQSARRRRVLHIEYAGFDLPPPLRWHEAA
ncbi:MAG: phytanoyl-CoA dioxygenase family protein [Pirellulales bacterium]